MVFPFQIVQLDWQPQVRCPAHDLLGLHVTDESFLLSNESKELVASLDPKSSFHPFAGQRGLNPAHHFWRLRIDHKRPDNDKKWYFSISKDDFSFKLDHFYKQASGQAKVMLDIYNTHSLLKFNGLKEKKKKMAHRYMTIRVKNFNDHKPFDKNKKW